MRFMYLVATVTAQGLAVAQEQEGRMLIKRPFPQQGNLFKHGKPITNQVSITC